MTPLCQHCTRPSQQFLCPNCWTTTADAITLLPWLDRQLTVSRTRQARLTATSASSDGQPVGYGIGASRAQDALRTMISTWARDLRPDLWLISVAECAAVLLDEPAVRNHPAAGKLVRDVERARDRGLERINAEEALPTLGTCGAQLDGDVRCPAYLYAARDASWVRCKVCRTQHETRDRREWMRARLEQLSFRAATLARLLPLCIDRKVSADLIRHWAGYRAIRTDVDASGWPVYRFGDVLVAAAEAPQRTRRTERSAA